MKNKVNPPLLSKEEKKDLETIISGNLKAYGYLCIKDFITAYPYDEFDAWTKLTFDAFIKPRIKELLEKRRDFSAVYIMNPIIEHNQCIIVSFNNLIKDVSNVLFPRVLIFQDEPNGIFRYIEK